MDYVAVSRHGNDLLNVTGRAWSRLSGLRSHSARTIGVPTSDAGVYTLRHLARTSWDGPFQSVTVRRPPRRVMKQADWAEEIARKLLEIPLRRR